MNRAPSRNRENFQLAQLEFFHIEDTFGFYFRVCWEPEWIRWRRLNKESEKLMDDHVSQWKRGEFHRSCWSRQASGRR